ncbi:armadillo-type protein [Mycena floridula]|nr:armadillo-type protein [Mycena floridula]
MLGMIVQTFPHVICRLVPAICEWLSIQLVEALVDYIYAICCESSFYNPKKVKNFLKEAKLTDQLPLIIVCDQFNFVHDLVLYFYQNGLVKFVEVHVQKVNAVRTLQVVGGLLDVDCDETTIKDFLLPRSMTKPWSHVSSRFLHCLQPATTTLSRIDTELVYAYAKTDRLHNMEDFLGMTNMADVLEVGEKCFKDELYQAAKLLFLSISNWTRLTTTLIYLGENQAAVEGAQKASNTQVWKQVHIACLEKSEFRPVQICGLNIVVHVEELNTLVECIKDAVILRKLLVFWKLD